jgi:hypothetical protein
MCLAQPAQVRWLYGLGRRLHGGQERSGTLSVEGAILQQRAEGCTMQAGRFGDGLPFARGTESGKFGHHVTHSPYPPVLQIRGKVGREECLKMRCAVPVR